MPGGLSDELSALHARRAEGEQQLKANLYEWALEHLSDQRVGDVKALGDALCAILSRAVMDAYNLPRPAGHGIRVECS